MNKRTLVLLVSCSQLILVLGDELFPLRMPGIRPTRSEAYLCTGVTIGPDTRFHQNFKLQRNFIPKAFP